MQAQAVKAIELCDPEELDLTFQQDSFLNSREFDSLYHGYECIEFLLDSIYNFGHIYFQIPELGGKHEFYLRSIEQRDSCIVWMGVSYDTLGRGYFGLIQKDDLISGFIFQSGHYWSLFGNGGNKIMALKHNRIIESSIHCSMNELESTDDDELPNTCAPADYCNQILHACVEVTENAESWLQLVTVDDPDSYLLYLLNLELQMNTALLNSGILNKKFKIETWNLIEFTHHYNAQSPYYPDIHLDIDELSNSSSASYNRYQYGCDFSILLTNQFYRDSDGLVYAGMSNHIGPDLGFCAIVEASWALSSSFVFTHEIGHILGCRHNDYEDMSDTCNHAYLVFNPDDSVEVTVVGAKLFPTWGTILHFSNPFVRVYGQRSGTGNDNNALAIENNWCYMANYEPDPYWSFAILGKDTICLTSSGNLVYTASVHLPTLANYGHPPYEYHWQYAYDWDIDSFPNYNWLWVPNEGDTLIIPYTPNDSLSRLLIRLIVVSSDDVTEWVVKHVYLFPNGCEEDPHIPLDWWPKSPTNRLSSMVYDENNLYAPAQFRQNLNLNKSMYEDCSESHFMLMDMTGRIIKYSNKEIDWPVEIFNLKSLPSGFYILSSTTCRTQEIKTFFMP